MADVRSIDPDETPLAVRHSPSSRQTDCHTLSVTQAATSGRGSALNLDSDNADSPLIRGRGPGPLLRLYNAAGTLKFEVGNDGTISAQTIGTLTVTGNATIGGTLGVTGATTLGAVGAGAATLASATVTGAATVGTTLGVTGAVTLSSTLAVTGTATLSGNVTVGGTFGVTGYTTLAGGQANGNWAIFGNLSAFGSGKAYRFRTDGSSLDLEATGVDLILSNWSGTNFDGTQRSYLRFAANALASQWAGKVEYVDALYGTVRHTLDGAANTLGFHGATPVAKQTVSGSRGGNAALADLLTKLATLGVITDGTSA